MSKSAFLSYLSGLKAGSGRPTLDRIRFLMEAAGHPQRRYAVVHVAGSAGKGSVATMIAAACKAAGLRTGLFTKPHLERFNERIAVDGEPAGDAELEAAFSAMWPHFEACGRSGPGAPTPFDAGAALAFQHFAAAGVEIAVIETGLGGRWDSTNVVDPAVCVITRIGLAHTEILGGSLAEIAQEKAGIIKRGRPCVMAPQEPEAREALREAARRAGSPLIEVELGGGLESGGSIVRAVCHKTGWEGTSFSAAGLGRSPQTFRLRLVGAHQAENGASAAAALWLLQDGGWKIGDEAIRAGLAEAFLPGRLEVLPGTPPILLDGAQTEVGARSLARSLRLLLEGRRCVVVFACTGHGPPDALMRPLQPVASAWVLTKPASSRLPPVDPEELAPIARELSGPDAPVEIHSGAAGALEAAERLAGPDGFVCVAGSIYLVGEARAAMAQRLV